MPKETNWKKEKFVTDELTIAGTKVRKNISTTQLKNKSVGVPQTPGYTTAQAVKVDGAWVVSASWLMQQAVKCLSKGQETMRFAIADELDGSYIIRSLYIEGTANPGGWNNDWPTIGLP